MKISVWKIRRMAAKSIGILAVGTAFAQAAWASPYPAWQDGGTYAAGTIVSYNSHLYQARINQTDTAGAGWNPLAAPSLWLDLGMDSPPLSSGGYPVWQDGGTYSAGAIVYFNAHNYRARIAQTDYLGAGWNPTAAPSLWLDLGLAPNQDKPWTNVALSVGAASPGNASIGWKTSEVPFNGFFGSSPPPMRYITLTLPNAEWQILDGGALVYSSHDYSYAPPYQLPGCDPVPNEPLPTCNIYQPQVISGFHVQPLATGTRQIAVRICDNVGKQCYVTPFQTLFMQ